MSNNTINKQNIFLCHSSFDKDKIRLLYKRLTSDGFLVWLDEESILPGQDWENEIKKAIKRSDIVLICLSNTSLSTSGYLHKEIKLALDASDEKPEGAIFIVPARLENCNVPDRLKKWQWVDLFAQQGYEKLVLSLRANESQRENFSEYAQDIGTRIQYGTANFPPSLYVPLVPAYKPDEYPKQLTVTLKSTGNAEKDKKKIRTIYGTLISYYGADKFSFQIFENNKVHLIDFPNDTTRVSPDLIERLSKLLDSEKDVRVEQIQSQ